MLCSIYNFILHQQKVKQFSTTDNTKDLLVKDLSDKDLSPKDVVDNVKDFALDAEVRAYNSDKDLSEDSDKSASSLDKSFVDRTEEDSVDMEDVSGRLSAVDRVDDSFSSPWDFKVGRPLSVICPFFILKYSLKIYFFISPISNISLYQDKGNSTKDQFF